MTLTREQQAWQCGTCNTTGRLGYCAPNVCLCGHQDCHAYPSWTPRRSAVDSLGQMPSRRPVENHGGTDGSTRDYCATTVFATRRVT